MFRRKFLRMSATRRFLSDVSCNPNPLLTTKENSRPIIRLLFGLMINTLDENHKCLVGSHIGLHRPGFSQC